MESTEHSDGGAPSGSETSYAYDEGSVGGSDELTSSQQKRSRVDSALEAAAVTSAFAGGARYASMTAKQLQSRMESVVSGAFGSLSCSRAFAFAHTRHVSLTHISPRAHPRADVTETTALSREEATLALHVFKWNSERLLEAYWAGEDDFREKVGIRGGATPPPPPPADGSGRLTCAVELDDFAVADMDALPCGHYFSKRAWGACVNVAMANPLAAQTVRCLAAPECRELVRARFFDALLAPPLAERWRAWGVRAFAAESRNVVFCPGVDCELAVVARAAGRAMEQVCCIDGHAFCFGCGGAPHTPATCADIAAWTQRDNADGLSALWLMQHTKPCPKCAVQIERSSGCNKVICSKCATAMCWSCGLSWVAAGHAYPEGAWTCNKPPMRFEGSASGGEMARFAHFQSRVISSAQSADFAAREIPVIKERADELFASITRGNALPMLRLTDLSIFSLGLCAVRVGREFLQASYKRAFSITHERELNLFTDQQGILEGAVERLQQLVESSALTRLTQECKGVLGAALAAAAVTSSGAGGGASSLTSAKEALCAKLETLRIDVLSLIRTIDTFMANLTAAVADGGVLAGFDNVGAGASPPNAKMQTGGGGAESADDEEDALS